MSLSSSISMSITPPPSFPPPFPTKLPSKFLPLYPHTHHHHTHYPKALSFTKISFNSHSPKNPFHPFCSPSHPSPLDGELEEGILDILTSAGATTEEAKMIVSKAGKYVKMVREGVRELDEMGLWGSWLKEGGMTDLPPLGLKEKVVCIAKEKGDNGKIAYLESVGLSLSSAIHLARTLNSHSLPSLMHKVKFVKEIFFSGSVDERLVGKLARRMMCHLSISVDEDVQQTLSFFEKIEARRGGLDMLGNSDTSFRYLIESFPRLLLLSVDSNIKPKLKILENAGVPKARVGNVLLLYPPLLLRNTKEDTSVGSWIIEKVGSSDKEFGRMLVKYPWTLSAGIQKNYEQILAFLEAKKVPKASIDRAIRDWPQLLGCSTDKLKPMVEQFNDLGVKSSKLGKVIGTSPQLLLRKPNEFLRVVSFLQDVGMDRDSIRKILVRCPEIFSVRTEETLQKKLDFLTGFGVLKQKHSRVVVKYPEILVSDVEKTIMPRLRYLMKSGLSERDVASMVVRFSPLLGYSIEEVLRPKLEFLVNDMGRSVKEVVDYPRYFSYSLETKIKPRFFVLRDQNINCSLTDMLFKNNEEFASEYLGVEKTFVSTR